MALTSDQTYPRRGLKASGTEFGYPVAPGETVYRGSLCNVNAAGQLQRLQTASGVAFVGMAEAQLVNAGNAAASALSVVALKGVFGIPVASATVSNIGASVYASDDGTLTLVSTGNTLVGTLVGIENGLTYVKLLNS
jgi:predicted RecA/RadA family phage recombinase